MKKFKLSHIVLYAKGWYHQTDDIFRDLRFALTLDDYSGEFFSDKDIVRKLLQDCGEIDKTHFTMDQIYCGIQKNKTFMSGYVHKDSPIYVTENYKDKPILNEYDMDIAIVMYLLSGLKFLNNDEWEQTKPIYGKGLGKPYHLKATKVKEHFDVISE
jgi:hypothetical protein